MRHSPLQSPLSLLRAAGFSRIEILIAACIIIASVFILIPTCVRKKESSRDPSNLTQTLANMQRLQQAAARMATDGGSRDKVTNNQLAWPGDLKGSFLVWASNLVEAKYLTGPELAELLSSPQRQLAKDVTPFANNAPVLVYTVSESSPPNTVFLTTDNFINTSQGGLADGTSTSKWGPDFAVVRKDGSGNILKPSDIGQTNTIGAFVPLCH